MRKHFHRPTRVGIVAGLFVWVLAPSSLHAQGVSGYYNVSVPPGFSMIANQLNSGGDTVAEVLTTGLVDGMALYRFDETNQTFSANTFRNGAWSNPGQLFPPGEGVFIFNPAANTALLTFTGSLNPGTYINPIPAGLSMRSSMLPLDGRLDTLANFPAAEGDIIYSFNNASGTYKIYTYDLGSWTAPPIVAAGESFFVWTTTATNWVQTFNP
ncbi:MAG: hypothetical protein ACYDH9_23245 [Limisphaerales bacterium]